MATTLSDADRIFFESEGYLILKGFYDVEQDIDPIRRGIYDVIDLVAQRHSLTLSRPAYTPENFDAGYNDLLALDRSFGAEVYDLTKQIPAFLRLICLQKADDLFRDLRSTEQSGIGTGSYGIRIDNPNEAMFLSHWHQEFLWQPQSIDGIVFWTPLMSITPELGPVIVLPKSNRDGLCHYRANAYSDKTGVYQFGIQDESDVISRYEKLAPLTEPGDLMIMDFLTIHSSGANQAARSRWSVQSRFFNFRDPVGQTIGWKASATAGTRIQDVFPENFSDS